MLFSREQRKGREQNKNMSNRFEAFRVLCVVRGSLFSS